MNKQTVCNWLQSQKYRAGRFLGAYLIGLHDNTQFGILCKNAFTREAWSGTTLPVVTGYTRVYIGSFKPTGAIATELLTATFSRRKPATTKRAKTKTTTENIRITVCVPNANDLVLVSIFGGSTNYFPTAPNCDNGISGPALVSFGDRISWPAIRGGCNIAVSFAVEESVIHQIKPPEGCTLDDLVSIEVSARLNLIGSPY